MLSSIVIARIIDKSSYASLAYVDNLYSYIALASGLGMSSALLKFCSAEQEKRLDKAYVKYAIKIGGTFEFIAALLICVVVSVSDIPYQGAHVFAWALLLYPLLDYLSTTAMIYMRTQLQNKEYAWMGLLKSSSICVLSVLLVVLVGTAGIIQARYLSVGLVMTYCFCFFSRTLRDTESIRLSREQKREMWAMALSLMTANLFSGMMPINEAFLVNNLIRDETITANFRVAGLLPQFLTLVSGAVTVYYFPIVARMKNYKAVRRKVTEVALVNGAVILFLTACGILCTPLLIRFLYGEKYFDAISISYVLWLMRASNCLFRMVPMNMLPAMGKAKFNAWVSIGSCLFQIFVDSYFILRRGIWGVAYGAIAVYIVSAALYWTYFLYVCRQEKDN